MFLEELNPIIFVISLLGGYFFWIIVKMTSRTTTSDSTETKFENTLFNWWTVHKISKWKNQNKTVDNYSDKHLKYFGCNQTGEALFVEFRNNNGIRDANFTLRLKDGSYLTTPVDSEHGLISNTFSGKETFSADGLTFERLVPYSKWRITYNGLCYIRNADDRNESCDVEPKHVTFSFLLASENGFDQFGSLFGQVIIESDDSKDTFEMNLPGVRMSRNLNGNNTKLVSKTSSIFAACKDGLVISLSARAVDNNNRVFTGCVRMPSMEVHRVEDVNLNVTELETKNISREIRFNIKSQKNLKAVIRIIADSSETIENAGFMITQVPFSIDVNGQPGAGYFISSKKTLSSHSRNDSITTQIGSKSKNGWKSDTLSLFFNEPDAQSEHLCGGKGSSLAFLTQLVNRKVQGGNAFVVPQGFSLTTDAFDLQLKNNPHIKDAISNIENIAYKRANGTLEQACGEVLSLFTSTPIAEEVAAKIKKAFSILENNSGTSLKVAVRSSAIGEDGTESSSAGQNETFLGVQTMDQVLVPK